MYTRLGYLDEMNVANKGLALLKEKKKRLFVSQKNSTIKPTYYLRTISGNTDQYRAKYKNKVSFMLIQQDVWSQNKLHKLTLGLVHT